MPVTVVRCSNAGCQATASSKIAAPWKYGDFSELKTYGYSCADHSKSVIEYARKRPKPSHFSQGEWVGEIGVFDLADSAH
jgi:hypothetical protein